MKLGAQAKIWWLAARPKTLTASLSPILVGTALAASQGVVVNWMMSAWAFVAVAALQIGTNFFNDAIDFVKGTDTAERLGPMRASQSGLLLPQAVLRAGVGSFVLAVISSVPLVVVGGWPIVVIGVASLLCGYAYTGGPFPLSYRGVGELFVILFFGVVAVSGMSYLHTHGLNREAIVAGLQVGLLATVLLAVNNLRDREGDTRSGKKTFAVRFGARAAKGEIFFLCFFPFLLNAFWFFHGHVRAAMLPFLSLPLAVSIVRNIFRTKPSKQYNAYLAKAAALHLLFGICISLGLLWR